MREANDLKYPEGKDTYTYQDYEKWEGRWELIKGVPHDMNATPTPLHQSIVGNIMSELRTFLGKGECQVFVAPLDVRLSREEDYQNCDTVIQPDVLVVCQKERIDDTGLNGAPDLVVEVLSPATAFKDRNQKFKLYRDFGASEYWIVDPVHKTIEIFSFKQGEVSNRKAFGIKDEFRSEYLKGFSIVL